VIWRVRFSTSAEKYYRRLDADLRKRIKERLLETADMEDPLDHPQVRPLTGDLKGFFRLRVGGCRLIFSLLRDEKIIAVVNVFPRGDAY